MNTHTGMHHHYADHYSERNLLVALAVFVTFIVGLGMYSYSQRTDTLVGFDKSLSASAQPGTSEWEQRLPVSVN